MGRLLIVYSTQDGQTRKIAEFMKEQLTRLSCDLVDINDNKEIHFSQYEKVIVGASIRYGKFNKTLYQWINNNKKNVEKLKSSFFCVNLTARKEGKDTPEGSKYVQVFLKKSPWTPSKIAVFAGALYYPRYRTFDRIMILFIMSMTGGETDTKKEVEYTNWDKVRQYILEIEQW